MDLNALKTKAASIWTKERIDKITAGKKLLITPENAADLLYVCGIMNSDASISAHNVSKFLQINHLLQLLQPVITDLTERHKQLRIVDLACGNSYLALLLSWYLKHVKKVSATVVGIDSNGKVVGNSTKRASDLSLQDECRFIQADLKDVVATDIFVDESSDEPTKIRPHLVLALHACDVASDFALAAAIAAEADHFAIAPCCQAELARSWADAAVPADHPQFPLFKSPNLRREMAAHYTDLMRMLLARAHGYEVTATEFIPSEHTAKNRLLVGHRRGRFLKDAMDQYARLKEGMGSKTIALEALLSK